jgi:hypothetical protein
LHHLASSFHEFVLGVGDTRDKRLEREVVEVVRRFIADHRWFVVPVLSRCRKLGKEKE